MARFNTYQDLRSGTALVTIMLCTVGFVAPAFAQVGLEEIVVTARKQEEKLKDVPLAITAFSAETIQKAGTENLRDIAMMTPGLSVADNGAEYVASPVIRGLATNGDVGSENNVATFFNGIYVYNASAINVGLMDLERIEVVKGPVSALYGRNAFAGAINFISKEPVNKFEGRIEGTIGSDSKYKGLVVLNTPLVDDVFMARGSFVYDHFGGSYSDLVNGIAMGGYKKRDGSLSFLLKPSDALKVLATVYYGKDTFSFPAQGAGVNNCGPNAAGVLTQYCGEVPNADKQPLGLQAPSSAPPDATPNDRKVVHADLHVDYNFGAATASLLTGYNKVDSRSFNEFNARRNGITYNLIPGPGTVTTNTYFGGRDNSEDFSLEGRIASSATNRFRWKVGGFWFAATNVVVVDVATNSTPIPAGQSIQGIAPLFGWLSPGGRLSSPNGNTDTKGTDRQASGFLGLDYDILSNLTASGELRYTKEWKRIHIVTNATTLPVGKLDPLGPGTNASFHFWNTRLTLNYKPTPDYTLYVSAANGTKAGGFNTRASIAADLTFQPEKNWTYEAGLKSSLMGGRLSTNLSVYYVNWTDLQLSGRSSDPNNPGFVQKNFGTLHDYGFEAEAAALLTEGVTMNLGLAYTDPKFQDDAYDVNGTGVCLLIPSCAPLVRNFGTSARPTNAVGLGGLYRSNASKWQFTAGLDVTQPLQGDWNWFTRIEYAYKSRQFMGTDNLLWIPASNMANLRLGVERGPLRVTLWVDNLADFKGALRAGGNLRLTDSVFEQIAVYGPRRTVGGTVEYKF
jgi:outer membrane receptor protein involved in Fe transport